MESSGEKESEKNHHPYQQSVTGSDQGNTSSFKVVNPVHVKDFWIRVFRLLLWLLLTKAVFQRWPVWLT